ncbi:MAG: hypothetical protein BIFFINMI_01727 [Phycisphaerae bacterium]|nr:hypothetical protein [Phycisphaerae bacterium]
MTHLERFVATMEYRPTDRPPNWEAGAWRQTRDRWLAEGAPVEKFHWQWFPGEAALGMDPREFIEFDGKLLPPFKDEVLEEDERTQVIRDKSGRVRRALKEGASGGMRMSMDQFLRFAVHTPADWEDVKRRMDPTDPRRYEPNWRTIRPAGWRARQHPLIFAPNTMTPGFYWTARELMGTENLCYAWYDQPALLHDMMEHVAHFLIESARPVLATTTVDYICLAEDWAMKTGPLLSPATFREFVYPRLKRVAEFYKSHGVRYLVIDSDGNFEALIPMMLDAGVDATWPLERAAGMDPAALRAKFGRSMRLWGGVDKRELARGPAAIDAHLRTLAPLVAEGGFIPTVDHTVPPDVGWESFAHYIKSKERLIQGKL